MEKEAKNRYTGMGDARVDIQKALADPSGVFVQPATAMEHRTKLRLILPWVGATVVLCAIIAAVAVWNLRKPEPRQVIRFDHELPEGQQFSDLSHSVLAVSPDGKQFAYSTPRGIYLRSVDEMTAKLIAGTEGDTGQPFFSPDGRWIGYLSAADQKLKKIPIDGGAPVALCDVVTSFHGASWGADNTILYSLLASDIMRISANGGIPKSIIKTKSERTHSPQILPDGKSVLYDASSGTGSKVMVNSLGSGEPKELFPGSGARYLGTGHIVYSDGNNLFAIPFNADKLEVTGGQVPIVEGVYRTEMPQYAVSGSGTLVYIPGITGAAEAARSLVWINQNGKEEPLTAPPKAYSAPRISPDGTRVALAVGTGRNADIWIWELVRKTLTRLTSDEGNDSDPLWSLDGKRIVFASDREGDRSICWKAADGTGKIDKLCSASSYQIRCFSWSGGGKTLVFEKFSGESAYDIAALSMEGDRAIKPLLQEKFIEVNPSISPDGRWMAYVSNESGQFEVYVRPFPDVNSGKWKVSTSGGVEPRWSPDGRELFYRNGDAMMVVAVETKPTFKVGEPKTLFRGPYFSEYGRQWDISPDGKRFLMIKPPAPTAAAPTAAGPRKINVVLNWFEELKRRVPTGK